MWVRIGASLNGCGRLGRGLLKTQLLKGCGLGLTLREDVLGFVYVGGRVGEDVSMGMVIRTWLVYKEGSRQVGGVGDVALVRGCPAAGYMFGVFGGSLSTAV